MLTFPGFIPSATFVYSLMLAIYMISCVPGYDVAFSFRSSFLHKRTNSIKYHWLDHRGHHKRIMSCTTEDTRHWRSKVGEDCSSLPAFMATRK